MQTYTNGTKVVVTLTENSFYHRCAWYPKDRVVTAEVLKVYNNGKVKIVFDFLENSNKGSTQGRKGTNVDLKDVILSRL